MTLGSRRAQLKPRVWQATRTRRSGETLEAVAGAGIQSPRGNHFEIGPETGEAAVGGCIQLIAPFAAANEQAAHMHP